VASQGPNRDGIGSRVALLRRGRDPLWRRVATDGSYLSAQDKRVHYGLGSDADLSAAPVEALLVRWPDGTQEKFSVQGIDRFVTVQRGSGHPRANGAFSKLDDVLRLGRRSN
jgi:hypothetical protein